MFLVFSIGISILIAIFVPGSTVGILKAWLWTIAIGFLIYLSLGIGSQLQSRANRKAKEVKRTVSQK